MPVTIPSQRLVPRITSPLFGGARASVVARDLKNRATSLPALRLHICRRLQVHAVVADFVHLIAADEPVAAGEIGSFHAEEAALHEQAGLLARERLTFRQLGQPRQTLGPRLAFGPLDRLP